jgi:hypothetical protein
MSNHNRQGPADNPYRVKTVEERRTEEKQAHWQATDNMLARQNPKIDNNIIKGYN